MEAPTAGSLGPKRLSPGGLLEAPKSVAPNTSLNELVAWAEEYLRKDVSTTEDLRREALFARGVVVLSMALLDKCGESSLTLFLGGVVDTDPRLVDRPEEAGLLPGKCELRPIASSPMSWLARSAGLFNVSFSKEATGDLDSVTLSLFNEET